MQILVRLRCLPGACVAGAAPARSTTEPVTSHEQLLASEFMLIFSLC